jgi:hypothetical protein
MIEGPRALAANTGSWVRKAIVNRKLEFVGSTSEKIPIARR